MTLFGFSPDMERVQCRCKKCGDVLGEFANLWTQIGRNYVSPTVRLGNGLNVVSHGAIRVGGKRNLGRELVSLSVVHVGRRLRSNADKPCPPPPWVTSRLQEVACAGCQERVGTECLNTPTNHVLDKYASFSLYNGVTSPAQRKKDTDLTELT